jgi:circadian clock protein KaiC
MTAEQGAPAELYNEPAKAGIEGLDEILHGGFTRGEMHLIQGGSGTGKTTLGLQYLLAGARAGEGGLYVTLSQTRKGLETIARSHGWSLDGVTVYEAMPSGVIEGSLARQTVLHTAEVELSELTGALRRTVEETKPRRLVLDSIDVIRLLAGSPPQPLQELVALRKFFIEQGCTALFLGDLPAGTEGGSADKTELDVLAGSLVRLDQQAPEYGEVRRRLRVVKMRAVAFDGGYHNFRIRKGGLEVYPRLGRYELPEHTEFKCVQSGIETLDELFGGGLEQGTTCLLVGPSGSGKSTLGAVYCRAGALGGGGAAIFLFEERPETFKVRSAGVGMDLEPHLQSGRISIQHLRTAEISPGEFSQIVYRAVNDGGVKVVLIDSLTGYFNAMGNTPMLLLQMHELLNFLSRRGVLTLLVVSQEGFMTVGRQHSGLDVSYLSDSILLLRMFEAGGTIRRCIAAGKKRQGEHETSIRELFIRRGEVSVGKESLHQYRSILSGDPKPIAGGAGGEHGGGEAGEEGGNDG